jgi:hypothetical protein
MPGPPWEKNYLAGTMPWDGDGPSHLLLAAAEQLPM